VSKKAALAIHGILLAEHGGKPGILNEDLLHFAYERAPILRLAAIYAHGLTQNHAFVDGNKRVAFTVAATFLELNGFRLASSEQDALSAMDDLSAGRLSRGEFESWLEASCQEAKTP
jgi:death-on-curing protein